MCLCFPDTFSALTLININAYAAPVHGIISLSHISVLSHSWIIIDE